MLEQGPAQSVENRLDVTASFTTSCEGESNTTDIKIRMKWQVIWKFAGVFSMQRNRQLLIISITQKVTLDVGSVENCCRWEVANKITSLIFSSLIKRICWSWGFYVSKRHSRWKIYPIATEILRVTQKPTLRDFRIASTLDPTTSPLSLMKFSILFKIGIYKHKFSCLLQWLVRARRLISNSPRC